MGFIEKSKWMTICLMIFAISLFPLSSSFSKHKKANLHFSKFSITQEDSSVFPNVQQRVQRAGNINMCQTNWGFLGSWGRTIIESKGGCFNPNPDSEVFAPSFEFPMGSELDYLFWGGLWVGAKVNDSIFVSTGCDGWQWNFEFWTGGPAPVDEIKEKSKTPNPCYTQDAISDQDILSTYTDTTWYTGGIGPDPGPCDFRWHRPLNVKVVQKSYSWSEEEYSKFIIADYVIKNIGSEILSDVFVGLFLDPDIWHYTEYPFGSYGPQDDITGFLKEYEITPGDTQEVNIAWAADNDGWGYYEDQLHWTLRGIIGVKILDTSDPEIQLSYNWWFSDADGLPHDWGPWKSENQGRWAQENCYAPGDSFFPDHVLGTPCGDCSKYFMMSNGEIDYDQIYSCLWPARHPEEGWLSPIESCDDFTDGNDTRFLLSFGPFEQILPGNSIHFAIAYIIGENFHIDPTNGQNLPDNPDTFYAYLNFSDLVQSALTAQKLYDSLFFGPTDVKDSKDELVKKFSLFQNYPNPFNPETKIQFRVQSLKLRDPIPITLKIYNVLGQKVRTLVDERKRAGSYEVIWDGKDDQENEVASGIYFYQLKTEEFSQTRRMVLIR